MPKTAKQVIVLDLVSLTPSHLENKELTPNLNELLSRGHSAKMRPVFPAVTGPMQATFTTGWEPGRHGIVANGFYDRKRY